MSVGRASTRRSRVPRRKRAARRGRRIKRWGIVPRVTYNSDCTRRRRMRPWIVVRVSEQVVEVEADSPAEALAIAKSRLDRPIRAHEEPWKVDPFGHLRNIPAGDGGGQGLRPGQP